MRDSDLASAAEDRRLFSQELHFLSCIHFSDPDMHLLVPRTS